MLTARQTVEVEAGERLMDMFIAISRAQLAASGFTRHETEIAGEPLIWWTKGEGVDLVLIHGVADQAGTWFQVAPGLSVSYRVVVVNGGPLRPETGDLDLLPKDREEARRLMAALRDPASPPTPDLVLDDLVKRVAGGQVERMFQAWDDLESFLLEDRLGELGTPVDLLWGESDRYMGRKFPGGPAPGAANLDREVRPPAPGRVPAAFQRAAEHGAGPGSAGPRGGRLTAWRPASSPAGG